jgi:hypothetical protein
MYYFLIYSRMNNDSFPTSAYSTTTPIPVPPGVENLLQRSIWNERESLRYSLCSSSDEED